MIDQIKFIEALKEIKSLLGAGANIGAMNKIDKTITEYQLEGEQFDKWAKPVVSKLGLVPHIAILEQPKAPKTSVKVACTSPDTCYSATDRSKKQGYGLIIRVSSASVIQQMQKRMGIEEPELYDGFEEPYIFSCASCKGDTLTIAEGNFR